ncbi:MAG: protein translocase subunit SecD [Candidatus Marinimicrobia bacterium]|nr:protein translocase subunit SecD [Candidatus Neomarinimicrobiota bacterium]
MFKSSGSRWIIIAAVILFSVYKLFPTLQYYTMSEERRQQLELDDPSALKALHKQAINLGLDLQGGMHVILEVDIPVLARNLSDDKTGELLQAINTAENVSIDNRTDFFDELELIALANDIKLIKYYSELDGLAGKSNDDVMAALREQGDYAINSVLEIIRNRVDEFGVSEPTIQKSGKTRIIVELAGVKDTDRASSLLQRTALLEFKLVKTGQEFQTILDKIDAKLVEVGFVPEESEIEDIALVEDVPTTEPSLTDADPLSVTDTTQTEDIEDLFDDLTNTEAQTDLLTTSTEILKTKPFSGYLRGFPTGLGVLSNEINKFGALIKSDDVQSEIPKDSEILWGNKNQTASLEDGTTIDYRNIYFLKKEAVLTGGVVTDARAATGPIGSDVSGKPVVNLTMNADGSKIWARFTGANVDRNVAIVLDKKVYMAPVIKDRIPGGRTQISGLDDIEEAKDIANVLRAGKLPAPVKIQEERTIGPSLGRDSINAGTKAMFIGFILVIAFMVFYYKGSGMIATLALLLNIFFVLSVLAMLHATLTLPGLAGLILTIGMAVDANVIIFERIREELDKGKTVKASIDAGYERAFTAIFDANITTLIAAFVLAWIGSGPIKGFAVTLSAGIICSLFSAVFITRSVYMLFGNKKPLNELSI